MRYCPVCDEEYRDEVEKCSDDDTPLLGWEDYQAELSRQGRRPEDFRALTAVATFEDRFEADELAQMLFDEGFDVSLASSKAPTVGPLTNPAPAAWSIVVPEEERARAEPLVAEWRRALEDSRAEAERAAEAEEAASELPPSELPAAPAPH
jgi:hypothetical protein